MAQDSTFTVKFIRGNRNILIYILIHTNATLSKPIPVKAREFSIFIAFNQQILQHN